MSAPTDDNARCMRAKDRALIKRDTIVAEIRSIHQLAQKAAEDGNVYSQLVVASNDLDSLWLDFVIEDDAFLNSLLDLGLGVQYNGALKVEVRGLISFSKSILRNYETQSGSVGAGSVSNQSIRSEPASQGCENLAPSQHERVVNASSMVPTDCGNLPTSDATYVRLPEIPLPVFDGNMYKWPAFRDHFIDMVDKKPRTTDSTKLYYLRGCLKGDAADAVRGIPVSASAYKLTWATLKSRYDKPRMLASAIVERILAAPTSSEESLPSLTKFITTFDEGVSVLRSLNIPDLGDFILFSVASRCLPLSCRTLFETNCHEDYPSVAALFSFLKARVAVLERVGYSVPLEPAIKHVQKNASHKSQKPSGISSFVTSGTQPSVCKCCSGAHAVSACSKFKGWPLQQRVQWVRDQRICFLCLSDKHWSNRCSSKVKCSKCSRKHHVLIHEDQPSHQLKDPSSSNNESGSTAATSMCGLSESRSILLGTALVHIRDSSGALHTVRALIDSASQISAITTGCVARLGLRKTPWTAPVTGLSGAPVASTEGIVNCQVQPRFADEPIIPVKAWVFPTITSDMPRQPLPDFVAQKFTHLALADPSFATPSPIDVLLGADIFSSALNGKRVEVGNVYPVAFGSIFGWILIGPVPSKAMSAFHAIPVSLTTSIESLMDRFWHVEEPDAAPETFTDDGQCEAIFRNECSRDSEGRFTVPLPFREEVTSDAFHGSRAIALKRFENLERKLHADPRLRDMYVQFMSEYINLGHMTVAAAPGRYFIPHHAVYRASDPNSKIRVVFDASAASFTGDSLNKCLLTGPKLQQDVVDILLLFRLSRCAFTTDVCKMYRQILVNPEYRPFQHIFWRDTPLAELQEYELNTVTYGVNCAPYLAMRVIKSVAEQDCKDFPAVQDALLKQTYVDDICTGADSEEEALELQATIISIMASAGFELKKWSSNNKAVLDCVAPEDRATGSTSFDDNDVSGVKVLGLQWDHREDSFNYAFQLESVIPTKRGMLSLIAQIFDPLGFLAPTIFAAKHLMQRVWLSHVSWDEPLPEELAELWRNFVADLHILSKLRVPRFIGTRIQSRCILCGFCDASEKGYAAVVYIQLEDANKQMSVVLLGSKTKLAPTKTTTIPRLELCAAVLLSKWLHRIQLTLGARLNITDTFAWSDSSIVLSWLTAPHQSFKIFVSNRVHKIQSLLPKCQWHHIGSSDNPADCASRGLAPSELLHHQLYWDGPRRLYSPTETWSADFHAVPVDQLPELRVTPIVLTTTEQDSEWFSRFSSYTHMVRVVARLRRFIFCCRNGPPSTQESWLSRSELDAAMLTIIRSAQQFSFSTLHQELSANLDVSSRAHSRLRPFLDANGIICVGGRLRHSDLPKGQKFPMLLPKSSHLSMLIVRHWHLTTFHSGPRVLISIIGREFWILSLRSLIRSVVSKCTRCVRMAAVHPQPVMADLPRSRVSECRPFSRVGIDFAGPLKMTENRLRKSREYKVYIAVFVCFVVKAVHLEVVSDLSTKAFLAALDRFVARRGVPTDIYSDCGTNFVGAARQLKELINDVGNRDQISASVRTTWHFNPPSAPHFGGLWEAAVRSTKSLMVKVMGEHTFTLEEFTTIICRIEAILNSRPLTPASTDPSDLDCLTPGHFLIGQPLLTILASEDNGSTGRLTIANRWKLLHQCVQAFWKRWRDEYLQTLQCRHRWSSDAPSLALGDMVVIKDTNSTPLTWRLGRVIKLMPGSDGVVRVVRVSTQQGSMVRPVVKLVLLPTT